MNFRKHEFQHKKKLTKRMHNISSKPLNQLGVVEKEEELLLKSWTQKERKQRKNSGQDYMSTGGKLVKKRAVKQVQCKCAHKCNQSFGSSDRERIVRHYWSLDYANQRKFIFDNVLERKCHRQTTKNPSRRNYTFEYSFEGTRVCKQFFVGTLDIIEKVIITCKMKARSGKDYTIDFRGRHHLVKKEERERDESNATYVDE